MTATVPVHTLILSHANVDFDAFAGMLAAQLLYPGGRVCLHGGVNRNVREFYNLHADQIPSVDRWWDRHEVDDRVEGEQPERHGNERGGHGDAAATWNGRRVDAAVTGQVDCVETDRHAADHRRQEE